MGKFYNKVFSDYTLYCPVDSWRIDDDDVRMEWRDAEGLHEIFSDLNKPEDYNRCIIKACMDFNEQEPADGYTPADFPWPHLLIKMAFLEVLDEMIAYHAANSFAAASGGTNTSIHDRLAVLQNIRDRRAPELEKKRLQIKISGNYEDGYGGIGGPGGYAY